MFQFKPVEEKICSTNPNRKCKLSADSNTPTVLPGISKQKKSSDSDHPASFVQYKRGMVIHSDDDVNKYDIGRYISKKLCSIELYNVVENMWKPDDLFDFPITMEGGGERKRRKHFIQNWLVDFNWLAYSKMYDGAFCYPCVLFGLTTGHNSGKLNALYKSPLTFWTSAYSKFKDHEKDCKMHNSAVASLEYFRAVKREERVAVNIQLSRKREERIQKNRQKLIPMIKTVAFCGRQTIALRGHRDDETEKNISGNQGNFRELLEFRIDSGDTILKEHFETAPRNATYKSKTIQNEIINCIGDFIQDQIVNEVKEAKVFTIIADETPDISRKEQMPLSLRYVDKQGIIKEKFVRYIECDGGTSAPAIAAKIKGAISDLGLDMANVRGQGYDGASNMSGKNAGTAKLIQEDNSQAIYIHCFAHRLNLCVASSCEQQVIKNMMDTVRCVSEFFFYPKRAEFLKNNVKEFTPKERHSLLLDVCKTRWIARIDGLDRFEEMFEVVMLTLQSIRDNVGGHWNNDSQNLAGSLFNACSEFSFLMGLVVAKYFLYLLLPLTSGLQARELDIRKAYANVDFVKNGLKSSRCALNTIHKQLYERAKHLGDYVGVKPSKPRTCARMQHRDNHRVEDEMDYYRVSITIPFLEHIIQEMDTRFGNRPATVIKGFSIIPSIFQNQPDGTWKNDFNDFVSHYAGDLPSPNSICPELLLWDTYWRTEYKGNLPSSISDTLKLTHSMKKSFPNIYAALRVLATIPVTSCECERAVSVLRRLKTYLRNTMGQDRLNGLSLMSIHRDINIDYDNIVTRFARQNPRRMELINVLDD